MQVTFHPGNEAELRLTAAFFNDLADLQQLQREAINADRSQVVLAETPVEAPVETAQPETAAAAPKRNRKPKETPPEPEQVTEATAPVEEQVTTEPVQEDAAPVEAEAKQATEVTHDMIRTLYGELVQAGKREKATNVVKSFGFGAIKEIPGEKLGEVNDALQALK